MAEQKGNALFLILIAVALFAALSYAVTQSGRGGGSIDKEQAILKASQIVQYLSSVEMAVNRLKLIGPCDETELSFENPVEAGYVNAGSPADKSCHIFDPVGGGLSYTLEENWIDTSYSAEPYYGAILFSGRLRIDSVGVTAEPNLVMIIPYIPKNVCIEINNKMNVPNPGGNPPDEGSTVNMTDKFTGTFTSGTMINNMSTYLTGCYEGGTDPAEGYHVYHVLIVR